MVLLVHHQEPIYNSPLGFIQKKKRPEMYSKQESETMGPIYPV